MKTRIWKSAGSFFYCGQVFEAHYRADERELCPSCEERIVEVCREQALPSLGRQAANSLMRITVHCRQVDEPDEVEFTLVPAGEIGLMEPDFPAYVVEGFLASASYGPRWLSRVH